MDIRAASLLALVPAALAFGAAATSPATASERLVRAPQGNVLVLDAPAGAQQKLSASAAAHPFATERRCWQAV